MKKHVLITSGGSIQGLALLRCLNQVPDYRVLLADSTTPNIGQYFAHRSFLTPEIRRTDDYILSLKTLCENQDVSIIVPATAFELRTLASHKEEFAFNGIRIAVSEINLLNVLLNKRHTYNWLKQHDLPVLPQIDIANRRSKLPVIGKPVGSWGGRGVIVIKTEEERERVLQSSSDQNVEYIWQPFLSECIEISVDFALSSRNREISSIITRQRDRVTGGFAVVMHSYRDDALYELAQKSANLLLANGGNGLFNIQFLRMETGDYFITDVNPRIGTSAIFGLGVGCNLPLWACEQEFHAASPTLPSARPEISCKMIRFVDEFWLPDRIDPEIKGIVFDLDDTLLNQKQWMIHKLDALWALYSDRLPERSEFVFSALHLLEEGYRRNWFDVLSTHWNWSADFKHEILVSYRRVIPSRTPLYPDALPALEALRGTSLKLALMTDNPPESQQQKITACGLGSFFDAILYCRQIELEKPDPALFQNVSEQLEISSGNLLMVGDNLYRDVFGSLNANYRYAMWICRPGSFYNFDPDLLLHLHPYTLNRQYSKLSNLSQLSNLFCPPTTSE